MKLKLFIFSLFVVMLTAYGQIVPSSRLITWQGNVGVVGGIPARPTTLDCVNGSYAGQTPGWDLTGTSDMTSHVQACINATPSGQAALLVAGTYRLNTTINMASNMTLRGAGPNLPSPFATPVTKLEFFGSNGSEYIEFLGSGCFDPPCHTATWTAGYASGTTIVTLGNVTGLNQGDNLYLDVCDDNSTLVFGQGSDNSSYGQFTRASPPGSSTYTRKLKIVVTASMINGTNVTISPALPYTFPSTGTPWDGTGTNCTTGVNNANPGAYWDNSQIHDSGLENLYIDGSNDPTGPGAGYSVDISYGRNIWVKNVESNFGTRSHVHILQGKSMEIRDSYFHHSRAYAQTSYLVEPWHVTGLLVENNILDFIASPVIVATGTFGNVYGYNFTNQLNYTPASGVWLSEGDSHHGSPTFFDLFEGNVIPDAYMDQIWGSGAYSTIFRNAYAGWASCCPNSKTQNTYAITLEAHERNYNIVGNILGTSSYHTRYECKVNTGDVCTNDPAKTIYSIGYSGTDRSSVAGGDNTVYTSMLRTLNYDTVTAGQKNCATDGGPGCQGGDGTTNLPNSYYYSSKPSWYGACVWPPIDPVNNIINDIPAKKRFNGQTCGDTTPPVPGANGVLNTYMMLSPTSIQLNWTKATDPDDAQNVLQYEVFRSNTNNIDTVANAEMNGILLQSFTTNIATLTITGLAANSYQYFQVVVKDPAGNKAAYTMQQISLCASLYPSSPLRNVSLIQIPQSGPVPCNPIR